MHREEPGPGQKVWSRVFGSKWAYSRSMNGGPTHQGLAIVVTDGDEQSILHMDMVRVDEGIRRRCFTQESVRNATMWGVLALPLD